MAQVSLSERAMNDFDRKVQEISGSLLNARDVTTIQVNVGLRCNNSCTHCHLEASPQRDERMDWATMQLVVGVADRVHPKLVDVTGGAPELNSLLSKFVGALKEGGHTVQVRTNLAALLEPGMEGMIGFYHDAGVRLVASLPCYTKANVDAQRGAGAYEKSIEALKHLNAVGYGSDSNLKLDLMYNPGGAFLPPEQSLLESDYRENLGKDHGIVFNNLMTITNIPIGRFQNWLRQQNKYEEYKRLLKDSFNPETLDGLMCRHQIEVAWDGRVYDCDFNLALRAPVDNNVSAHVRDFDIDTYSKRRIVTGEYCFGCTAGHGSSCGGALA
jgi:radical SAM/Cys-rich protein